MATRSVDLECTETLRRETIFGIYDTDPDEVLEVLFECWKRSADDEATITETMNRAIQACMIRRAELPDSFSDSLPGSDSELSDSELSDSLPGSVPDALPDAGFCDFYGGAPG